MAIKMWSPGTFTTASTATTYYGEYGRGHQEVKPKPVIDYQEQRDKAITLLDKIHHLLDKRAIIAGGAPRNWVLNMPARDVDIYIPFHAHSPDFMIEMFCKLVGVKSSDLTNKGRSSGKNVTGGLFPIDIREVFCFVKDEIEYDVIFYKPKELNTSLEVINSFDVDLCKVYIDHRGRIVVTEDFERDITNGTITCHVDASDREALNAFNKIRLPKLKAIFPDYKLVGSMRNKGEVI